MGDEEAPDVSPLIAAAERADRRNLIVLGVVSALVLAAILLWGRDDGSSDAEDSTPPPLSARIELTATTVAAGGTLDGRVVVENNTGEALRVIGCGSLFQVALANEDYDPEPAWPLCAKPFTIPVGRSTYPVTVSASHLACVSEPPYGDELPCEGDGGMPPLPPGEYEARLFQGYEGRRVPEPESVHVRVVADP